MTSSELNTISLTEIIRLYSEGNFSPHDVLDSVLANVKRNEVRVHAYIHIETEKEIRKEADEAFQDLKKGKAGILCGIPLAIKDNTFVQGMPCTGGAKFFKTPVTKDAFVVSKLRESGAIFLGKTNLDEMAAFGVATNNPHYGRTYNPWNLERIPGGSSGGSAAAVAAGEAVASTGTDTGGSVRIPASFCGLTGLKPTYGRLSRSGAIGMSWTLDHFGVITRTVRDAELLTRVMSDKDKDDQATYGFPPTKEHLFQDTPDLNGIKLAVLSNPIRASDEGVMKSFNASVEKFSSLDASIIEIELPHLSDITPAIFAIALPETSSYHEQWLRDSPELYGKALRSFVELGHAVLATQYLKALRLKKVITLEVQRKLKDVDVVLVPTTPSVAPKLDQETITILGKEYPAFQVLSENTYPYNFLGLPALSIPNGFSDGMPTGLQLVAGHWREDILYRVGDAFQKITDYHRRVPVL